jgi:hypothetical protein
VAFQSKIRFAVVCELPDMLKLSHRDRIIAWRVATAPQAANMAAFIGTRHAAKASKTIER